METFIDRLSEIIDRFANGKHTVFAKKADIPVSTFQSYIKGKMPKPEYLLRIFEVYNISIDWLLTGEGEMIRGRDIEGDDPEISKLLEGTRKVLGSGNKVAHEALEAGIRYLSQTIDDLENMEETKKRQKNMESRMASLEARLKKSEEIRKEDSPEQQDEILKLRTTG